jgi:invasion protein IalB
VTLGNRGFALLLLVVAGSPAMAQGPVRHGDWELGCDTQGSSTASASCKITQRQSVAGTTVFAMTVLPAADGKTLAGIVSVPLGGYLAPGIELQVDRKKPFRLLYETCNATGCHAGFAMAGRVLADLEGGRQASVRVWTAKTKPVDVKVSLEGFDRAIAALKARQTESGR